MDTLLTLILIGLGLWGLYRIICAYKLERDKRRTAAKYPRMYQVFYGPRP